MERFRLFIALLLTSGLSLTIGATGSSADTSLQDKKPAETFRDELRVRVLSYSTRITDSRGHPILGLEPKDLIARFGDREVPILAVDWIEGGGSPSATQQDSTRPEALSPAPLEPTLGPVILWVQTDFHTIRFRGLRRLRPLVRELVDGLPPQQPVALLSYDSRLKLWQDLTLDREAIHSKMGQAIRFGASPKESTAGPLSEAIDFGHARKAAKPEQGLLATARALAEIPGEKTLILLGWGLGRYGPEGVTLHGSYPEMIRAMFRAEASVFVLDATHAGSHSLEVGLRAIASATGGSYDKTSLFASQAVRRLGRTIQGHYVVSLDAEKIPSRKGRQKRLQLQVANRKGSLVTRPRQLPPTPSGQ